ncbi:MAG: hypothetical protein MZV70_68475 [Desulfobacterales bacterium]|nr:hypothetical protein [Desulfobacterales bacterium]
MENDLKHLRGEIERLTRETGELQNCRARRWRRKTSGMLTEIAQGEAESTRLREEHRPHPRRASSRSAPPRSG